MQALNGLGINGWGLLSQVINFAILYFLLSKYAFPAIRRILDQRTETIRTSIEQAEQVKRDLAAAQEESQKILDKARAQAQKTIADSVAAGQRVEADLQKKAKEEYEARIKDAAKRIEQETEQAKIALRNQVADLVVLTAGKIIGSSLDDQAHKQMIENFLNGEAGNGSVASHPQVKR